MAGIGSLPASTPSAAPVGAPSGLSGASSIGQSITGLGPNVSHATASPDAAYAIGDIYNQYKKAQLDNVTQATQLSSASRQRLTQIWEMGVSNPALQQDGRVHAQIAQLYKTMGVPPPVNEQGQLDWNAMAPVKNLTELPPATLTALEQMTPQQRRNFVHSNHIIGADDAWLDQPATATPAQKTHLMDEYTKVILQGGYRGMSPAALRDWVENNRNIGEQVQPGWADNILTDPQIFSDMQSRAKEGLDKAAATIEEIKARTKNTLGLSPQMIARINLDRKLADKAVSMSDLDKIKYRMGEITLKDLPAMDQAKIAELNGRAAASKAQAQHWDQVTQTLKTNGGDLAKNVALIRAELSSADAEYRTAATVYSASVRDNFGAVPPEVQQAYDDSKANVDALKATLADLQSPSTQAIIHSLNTKRTTGVQTTPVNARPAFAPTMQYKGKPIMPYNGHWVYSDFSVVPGT